MNVILFDYNPWRDSLQPLTYTRPVSELRVGILTIKEKWESELSVRISYLTRNYLSEKFPLSISDENLLINGSWCPMAGVKDLLQLNTGESLVWQGIPLALKVSKDGFSKIHNQDFKTKKEIQCEKVPVLISKLWHLFKNNGSEIRIDFERLTKGRKSEPLTDPGCTIYGKENIFLESGAMVRAAILNAEDGPIYLGKNSRVQEGSIIKGPIAMGEGSHINMGAKVKGDSTLGPFCKVGGEISNSILLGYSNKAHDGFLGNSVIGEWCNIGADTNNSNLKNNYDEVKLWDFSRQRFELTGETFVGLFMGDHCKCAINTMFNTATVTGVASNIFGAGFPRTFIPSFSWGGPAGFITFKLEKVFEMAGAMMNRRGVQLTEVDKKILTKVFELSVEYRTWER
jgi:UDP-N-acetylglucosamine diphosphorylase/glucosamine-1-phosphate N-acetyltransferase